MSAYPRRLVSMKDAAAHLGCHYTTIQRRVADGSLPTVRVGRLIRVDLDALDAMESGPVPTAERPAADAPDPREAYIEFIQKLVVDAPPLTGEQRDRLTAILSGGL